MGDVKHLRELAEALDKYIGLKDSERGNFGSTTPDELMVLEQTVRRLIDEKFGLYHLSSNYIAEAKPRMLLSEFALVVQDMVYDVNENGKTKVPEQKELFERYRNLPQHDYKFQMEFHKSKRETIEKLLK